MSRMCFISVSVCLIYFHVGMLVGLFGHMFYICECAYIDRLVGLVLNILEVRKYCKTKIYLDIRV